MSIFTSALSIKAEYSEDGAYLCGQCVLVRGLCLPGAASLELLAMKYNKSLGFYE